MKVSREQMVENRRRILQEAGRLFRDRGFAAVTVADVMKAAGQTHGGFYGHFASKDDLIAATVADMLAGEGSAMTDVEAWTDAYLSPLHRENPDQGCPMASLAGLMRHQMPDARAAMARGLDAHLSRFAQALPGDDDAARRRSAIGRWAAMVGAVVLSRAVDDAALSDELLRETRAWIAATQPRARTRQDEEANA
ncbi:MULTISPECIES: TetR/AcrR family transcriptional regulator [unclassified Sphingomonas]|uniref:TetR/AcrR family transcriptional regulator n=1 Tax=unclassified Sphingomonas TaxID=196159 RepID=UPI0006FD5C51|nr:MULTISPECIES: TetR/AcrR family transcriptional regulator [unclassified Sphingomonas]KQM62286.1 transcriptional regulator [Sphingomonas sp. Leaf16]KQN13690.1 transcriptional regulator [Sphingomonas sp. Leaf29]KQN23080.1 transcriptional regulator [Sphingomonas sp. Leaf32]